MSEATAGETNVNPASTCRTALAGLMILGLVSNGALAESKPEANKIVDKPASAATIGSSTKSSADASRPNVFRIDPGDQVSAKACTDNGGVISKDSGNTTCTNPKAASSKTKECRTWQHPFDGLNIWMCRPCKAPTCGCDC